MSVVRERHPFNTTDLLTTDVFLVSLSNWQCASLIIITEIRILSSLSVGAVDDSVLPSLFPAMSVKQNGCMTQEEGCEIVLEIKHLTWSGNTVYGYQHKVFWVGGCLSLSVSLSPPCLLSLSPSEASPLTAVPANLSEHLWLLWWRI